MNISKCLIIAWITLQIFPITSKAVEMDELTGAYDTGVLPPNDGVQTRGAWLNIPWEATYIESIQLIISGSSTSGIMRRYNIYDGSYEDMPFIGELLLCLQDEDEERILFVADILPPEGDFTNVVANFVPFSSGWNPDFSQLIGINVLATLNFLAPYCIDGEPILDALATVTSVQIVMTYGSTTVRKTWGDIKAQFK
ncbi:MAG: hypothetical protein Q8O14_15065 [bacterium]|nr:hypothetical protein [bacterium]